VHTIDVKVITLSQKKHFQFDIFKKATQSQS
jgi:hypothetical protein